MTDVISEHTDERLEPDYAELPTRVGAVFSEADGDTLSLLERLGEAFESSAIVMVRPRRRSVIAECAWRTDGWVSRRVTLDGVTPSMLESLTAGEVVQLAVDAADIHQAGEWDAVWAATDSLVVGLAGSTLRLSSDALRIFATTIDVWVTRELSSVASRMVAVLRERALLAAAVDRCTSKGCRVVAIQLEVLEEMVKSSPQAYQLVGEIKACAETAITNMQAIVSNLPPISPRGTWSADDLEQFVEDVALARSLDVTFEAQGSGQLLDNENAELVFTFVQEGLENVRRHSETNRGKVHASFDHAGVSVRISDGELPHDGNGGTGHGHVLRLMRSWARLLGGDIRKEPTEDGVMALTLEVPL